ncbi:unnamed protein product, partial [Polarella glacialis]
ASPGEAHLGAGDLHGADVLGYGSHQAAIWNAIRDGTCATEEAAQAAPAAGSALGSRGRPPAARPRGAAWQRK